MKEESHYIATIFNKKNKIFSFQMHSQLVLALLLTVLAAAVSGRSFHRRNYHGVPRRLPRPWRILTPR